MSSPSTPGDDDARAPLPEALVREVARALSVVFGEIHALANDGAGPTLADRVGQHLGVDPGALPVLSHALPAYQLVDVQVALEAWASEVTGRTSEVIGVAGQQRRFHPLSELLGRERTGVGLGPVDYEDAADSPDTTRSCVKFGIFLLGDGDRRAAALLRGEDRHSHLQSAMLEVVATDPEHGRRLLADLRRLAVERSVLRGHVLALGPGEGHQYGALRFLRRPTVERAGLVLPEATRDQIERHFLGIATQADRLRAAGQHLKRGILLYGPPGTGKTHTVRYLLSQRRDATAFVLSGQSLGHIGEACALARQLAPAIVVLEDVDLIAGDRSFGPVGSNPLLFEVLNQIDGLGDDVDVTFLLTTNRVDILERALAERPGRVDAAVEITVPDVAGRRQLLRLYGQALGVARLADSDLDETVEATSGRTATFLREVVRRAALTAAEAQGEGALTVDGPRLAAAARDLLEDRAALTRAVLHGVDEPDAAGAAAVASPGVVRQRGWFQYGGVVSSGGGGFPLTGGGPPTPFGPEQAPADPG